MRKARREGEREREGKRGGEEMGMGLDARGERGENRDRGTDLWYCRCLRFVSVGSEL